MRRIAPLFLLLAFLGSSAEAQTYRIFSADEALFNAMRDGTPKDDRRETSAGSQNALLIRDGNVQLWVKQGTNLPVGEVVYLVHKKYYFLGFSEPPIGEGLEPHWLVEYVETPGRIGWGFDWATQSSFLTWTAEGPGTTPEVHSPNEWGPLDDTMTFWPIDMMGW